eukprot:TRINITY_DN2428_c1_g1_i3.p1 TRINITY_DN2428_c1_g1~~TRINITY_DN2428_c1_g1_i3.p1  ORF type:complete len:228 (+),score=39.50 TRINITY_DN2428_c1_g1_i3:45-728(+)
MAVEQAPNTSRSRTPSVSSDEEFDLFEEEEGEDNGEGWSKVVIKGLTVKVPTQRVHIWESSKMMAEWVEDDLVGGKVCLELGCGIGLPSIAAALCGAKAVYATDLSPAAIKELHAVIQVNSDLPLLKNIVPSVLDWNHPAAASPPVASTIDVLLAADVNYETACTLPLTNTIRHYYTPASTVIYVASRVGRISLQGSIESLSSTFRAHKPVTLYDDPTATHLLYRYS